MRAFDVARGRVASETVEGFGWLQLLQSVPSEFFTTLQFLGRAGRVNQGYVVPIQDLEEVDEPPALSQGIVHDHVVALTADR